MELNSDVPRRLGTTSVGPSHGRYEDYTVVASREDAQVQDE